MNAFWGKFLLFASLVIPLVSQGQRLKKGQIAPLFSGIDIQGDTIELGKYKGKKILLAFFRYASCPVCNVRMHQLIENHDSIQAKGYQIIAVFESANNTLKEYVTETPVPFPIIGDPQLRLYKKYRVEKSFWKTVGAGFSRKTKKTMKEGRKLFARKHKRDGHITRIPADFIIDPKGIIINAYYGKNIGDHLPLIELLK
ncbi:MAG: redoxin domain-containing protein [Bacteroidetes bacterium]|nr:redoxin domain-containing protein [Bacteroidota bacterium]